MPFILSMPKLSPTMDEGVIAKWHKKVGDYVDAGDVLLEISTDKATVEHTALDPGYLRKILRQEGDKAAINEPLAILSEKPDESIESFEVAHKAPAVESAEKAPTVEAAKTQAIPREEAERIMASPLARKIAKEKSIDLSVLQGSGPRGRIMKKDLETAAPTIQAKVPTKAILAVAGSAATGPTPFSEEQISPMRKVIGARLQASKASIPHFYIRQDVWVDTLVNFREELKKQEISCTINDFIVKACAQALKKHPNVNCGFNESKQNLIRFERIDIAVAVTIPGGLITPIVTATDTRSLTDISQTVKSLAAKAREGKLRPEEYQSGSFTISNLGMYGTTSFDAIVNPPQGAILAVGALEETPCVRDGKITIGKKLTLTLSCDHRIIDGAEAAQFMKTLKQLLENPLLSLV
jgi:pyruvate dehydrogenase E2 component (dihydrolipoamide acetyltransferase)